MIDTKPCGPPSPPRWRPSIAIYEYEPPEDFQELPDHLVMFVKVTVTLTGWAPDGDAAYTSDSDVWVEDYSVKKPFVAPTYYACYGAILSLAVFPLDNRATEFGVIRDYLQDRFASARPDDEAALQRVINALLDENEASSMEWIERLERDVTWNPDPDPDPGFPIKALLDDIWVRLAGQKRALNEFPYISDVEPKRRDVYEAVQETGEVVSRTLSGASVGKSSTHVESEEVLDVFGGGFGRLWGRIRRSSRSVGDQEPHERPATEPS
jgi:hypothetical protein